MSSAKIYFSDKSVIVVNEYDRITSNPKRKRKE
nr:MAG TPA: Protein of unknown function (DUF1132) [Caudoviricetes sp.]